MMMEVTPSSSSPSSSSTTTTTTTTTTTATIMSALSTLTPSHLSNLTTTLLSAANHHHRRLAAILSSPTLFSLTLHHLHTLSLRHKTLLIARHLLSSLHRLTRHLLQSTAATLQPPPISTSIRQRELDAVLLLLLFCETHNSDPEILEGSVSEWRAKLAIRFSENLLTLSCAACVPIGESQATVLIRHVEMVARCRRLVGALDCGEREVGEVAASAAAVVALPVVEVAEGGRECVICKEEMRVGRDVCELPCQHLFHWMCILPWLGKRNTCPCCRFRLPSDDVFGEIQRLWEVLVKLGGKDCGG